MDLNHQEAEAIWKSGKATEWEQVRQQELQDSESLKNNNEKDTGKKLKETEETNEGEEKENFFIFYLGSKRNPPADIISIGYSQPSDWVFEPEAIQGIFSFQSLISYYLL